RTRDQGRPGWTLLPIEAPDAANWLRPPIALTFEHGATRVWVPDKHHAGEPGHELPQELQPLPAKIRGNIAEPGDIPAGVRETCHEPGANWVGGVCHHDRNRPGLSFDRGNRSICACNDHVGLEGHELPSELWNRF